MNSLKIVIKTLCLISFLLIASLYAVYTVLIDPKINLVNDGDSNLAFFLEQGGKYKCILIRPKESQSVRTNGDHHFSITVLKADKSQCQDTAPLYCNNNCFKLDSIHSSFGMSIIARRDQEQPNAVNLSVVKGWF